jgi:hypothetical protein
MEKAIAFFKGLAHSTIDYAKEYDGDATVNHAKGELSTRPLSCIPLLRLALSWISMQ